MNELNIKSKFIMGLRVTDENTMTIVEKALLELNTEILNNLTNKEANAKSVTPKSENIIKITPEKKELGFVGNPKKINKEALLNIVIEKSIGLTSSGKQFSISKKLSNENLFTSEAIFLLSYQNFEPIKLKSKQKTFVGNSIIAR